MCIRDRCGSDGGDDILDGSAIQGKPKILRPGTTDFPHPDSPLSDYYVPDTRALEEKPSKTSLTMLIAISAGGACLIAFAFLLRNWHKAKHSAEAENNNQVMINRNKDKMVATVLVDMRMHGGEAALNESLAETDEQLTESVACLLYTSPSPRDATLSRMPSSA